MASVSGPVNGIHLLTPNTNSESSPPEKISSPRVPGKRSYDEMKRGTTRHNTLETTSDRSRTALTPAQTPPDPPPAPSDPIPGSGKIRALRIRYDPHEDRNAAKDRHKLKPTYVAIGVELRSNGIREPGYAMQDKESTEVRASDTLVADIKNDTNIRPPDPRLALVGYAEGGWYQEGKPAKTRPRRALRITKPFADDPSISIGRGPATQVVVSGFDPFTPERSIRTLLETYGEIARLENRIDPANGSFLGVCSVIYRDKATRHESVKAVDAARLAEKNGTGQKIGVKTVRVERDPIGARAKRLCRRIIDGRARERQNDEKAQQAKAAAAIVAAPVIPTGPKALTKVPPTGPAARPNAPPTGPAARPAAPAAVARLPPKGAELIEQTPILPTLKTKPYVYIAQAYVPVMGSTIEHLKKRMRAYEWEEIRCDLSGYYIIFPATPDGVRECKACYKGCHGRQLFTYTMSMLMQTNDPSDVHHKRAIGPQTEASRRAEAADEKKQLREEDEADFEREKKERAERLDPVKGALELLAAELIAKVVEQVKRKYATPTVFERLEPSLHTELRALHNIPEPQERSATTSLFSAERTSLTTPLSAVPARIGLTSHNQSSMTWRRMDTQSQSRSGTARQARGQQAPIVSSVDVYADERRKKPKKVRPQQTHRRLQDLLEPDSDSDDDSHTLVTRDSQDADSRAVSEVPSTPARMSVEPTSQPPSSQLKRKRAEKPIPVERDDEDTAMLKIHLPHLLGKEPEDMAMRELQQVISTLARASQLRSRALAEVKQRKQAEEDDMLFGIKREPMEPVPALVNDVATDDVESVSTPEPTTELIKPIGKKKATKAAVKPKKKTKKQLLEEQEAAAKEEAAKVELLNVLAEEEAPTPAALAEDEEPPKEEEARPEVEWSVSTDSPRRTVEDDDDLFLDLDGWQHVVKDDEDLQFLQLALIDTKPANIPDVNLWSWTQKQIKGLNNGGIYNTINHAPVIPGYYKPSPSGCARSEPVTKALNEEKNYYLPHRIRVRKAREEREAQATLKPTEIAAKATAPAPKINAKNNSRAARADNRRVVNELLSVKETLVGEGNVAVSFNQLKKRKKQVRFDRSAIHNWGLYADENITANEMIIEYVGEVVRQKVADIREQRYDAQGVGSSYLFRLSDDRVVDATKKGGIARFINHSCSPSCTAKIIRVDGTHRIVIYALRDIVKNEELTYDYKFEREINSADRIPCLCGADNCKGFLN